MEAEKQFRPHRAPFCRPQGPGWRSDIIARITICQSEESIEDSSWYFSPKAGFEIRPTHLADDVAICVGY